MICNFLLILQLWERLLYKRGESIFRGSEENESERHKFAVIAEQVYQFRQFRYRTRDACKCQQLTERPRGVRAAPEHRPRGPQPQKCKPQLRHKPHFRKPR